MKEYTTESIRNIALVSHGGAGKTMLAYRVIRKVKDQLKVFSRAAGQLGFGGTLVEMFRELY
jgi:ATP-dependent helicase/DNAse subunit B